MSEENNGAGMAGATWAVLLIAIIVGLVYYYLQEELLAAIGIPIVIFGVFEVLSAFFRDSNPDRWGTSDSGAAIIYGFICLAVGGAILVFQFSDSIIFPIVYALIIAVLFIVVKTTNKGKQ